MKKRYTSIPEGYSECPVCNGTGLTSLSEIEKSYSWNRDKTTKECNNCGGQMMYSKASGITRNRVIDNLPCVHEYSSRSVGRNLTEYSCKHCNTCYQIDSGD